MDSGHPLPNVQQLLITSGQLKDNKIKRRDKAYTTVAVKDGKSMMFFSVVHLACF